MTKTDAPAASAPQSLVEPCPSCQKRPELCLCGEPRKFETRHHVLILQHPQEPDKDLGSARLAHLALPNSTLRIGLSWANLGKALGREAVSSKWAVLHLGSGIKAAGGAKAQPASGSALVLVDKKGVPLTDQKKALSELEGIVILDGTWSQAKALWWRNAWLLKLKRAILAPARPSLYKDLRKEPRRECLSTIESVATALQALGEPTQVEEGLNARFQQLLSRYRGLKAKLKLERQAASPREKP